jgi:glycosyltransferase involved in cell wall biosynthesis
MSKMVICRMDLVICVNRELFGLTLELGAPDAKVILAPGILPPTDRCQDRDMVNPAVWEFLEGKNPILAANGKVSWYQGVDLYGLDLLIDLVAQLKHDYPKIALIVCFWDHAPEDGERVRDLNKKAADAGLAQSVYLNTAPGVFIPVLAKSSVFIRPTATDGDANSIREALALGTPAVASDVVDRPDGCLIHRNRDLDSLVEKTRIALESQSDDRLSPSMTLTGQSRERINSYIDSLEKIAE